jgi:hypothetical protein
MVIRTNTFLYLLNSAFPFQIYSSAKVPVNWDSLAINNISFQRLFDGPRKCSSKKYGLSFHQLFLNEELVGWLSYIDLEMFIWRTRPLFKTKLREIVLV